MFFLISNSSIYHFRIVVDRLIIGKQALIIHVLWWSEQSIGSYQTTLHGESIYHCYT